MKTYIQGKARYSQLVVYWAFVIIALTLSLSCRPPELTPAINPENDTPAPPPGFTTYTSEGLYRISYPQDWSPSLSILEEIEESAKEWFESIDPEIDTEGFQLLFMAGIPTDEGYYPTVTIGVTPRSIGYNTLDQISEVEESWARENKPGYKVLSRIRTVVDGREADIIIEEDDEPGWGKWQYVCLTTIHGDFVWVVCCSSESKDFTQYEDVFNDVVRSMRILN